MNSLLQDIRFSLRVLAKTPGFTGAIVIVLALGIGLNTSLFGLLYAIAFSPQPFAAPDQIVQLHSQHGKAPNQFRAFSLAAYHELRQRNDLFSGVLAQKLTLVAVGESPGTRRALAAIVSRNFLEVLGVPLAQGRSFTANEETPGAAEPVVVASHAYWRKSGFDPGLLGASVHINGRAFTVVGITPENFNGTMAMLGAEFYFPLGMFDSLAAGSEEQGRSLAETDVFALLLTARVRTGVSSRAAESALKGIAAGLERLDPVGYRDTAIIVGPLPRGFPDKSPADDGPLQLLATLLLALSGSVLLIVSLNLAGLLLARGHARRKELAIRLALGGTRTRLVRQLLTEGLVLALLGGALGCMFAIWGGNAVIAAVASRLPVELLLTAPSPVAVVGSTFVFSMLATLFFALGPALRISRRELVPDLQQNAGEEPVRRRQRWLPRHPLAVAQIGLSVALIIGAGLFARMIRQAVADETGIDPDHTLVAEFDASLGGRNRPRTVELFRTVAERLEAIPGVQSVSIAASTPYSLAGDSRSVRRAEVPSSTENRPVTAGEERAFSVPFNAVGSDYFATIGLPLLRGRVFTRFESDHLGAPPVAIIDEALAELLWPGEEALGRHLVWTEPEHAEAIRPSLSPDRGTPVATIEVVGIARTAHLEFFQQESPGAIYVPFAQGFTASVYFFLRSAEGGERALHRLREPVRQELQSAAPDVPFAKVQSFREHKDASLELWLLHRISAIATVFAAIAALIAVVGLYGTTAYGVARRTREIGVRLALGAEPRQVRALILREGLSAGLLGIAFGLLLGAALARIFGSLISEFQDSDPFVFGLAALGVLMATLVASWLPARRATRVNPMMALRSE